MSLKSQVDWNITLGYSLLYKVVFVFCGGKGLAFIHIYIYIYNNNQRHFSFPCLDGSACVFRVGVCL